MPWNTKKIIEMKIELIEKVKTGESVTALAKSFGVSRKTLYKWMNRHHEGGINALHECSRAPKSTNTSLSENVVCAIMKLRLAHKDWGARKLVAVLSRQHVTPLPSVSSVHRVLNRCGLIEKKSRRRLCIAPSKKPQKHVLAPNDLWTVDFKGWWRSKTNTQCIPLTVRDEFSRFVLAVVLVKRGDTLNVKQVFDSLFRKYGLPKAIQSDNGSPFASHLAVLRLSKLSAWWLSLGINVIHSRPGCPQDNGGHERMHRDMLVLEKAKASTQAEMDEWRETFNKERPHEALGNRVPAEVYTKSTCKYIGVVLPRYKDMVPRKVAKSGAVKIAGQEYLISTAL